MYGSDWMNDSSTIFERKKLKSRLSAAAQEFAPSRRVQSRLESHYMPQFQGNSQYGQRTRYQYKPVQKIVKEKNTQREDGLDYSRFVVFSSVQNIPPEVKVSHSDDGPARLRLCLNGADCSKKDSDCPFTHVQFEKDTWNPEDENWPPSPTRTPSPTKSGAELESDQLSLGPPKFMPFKPSKLNRELSRPFSSLSVSTPTSRSSISSNSPTPDSPSSNTSSNYTPTRRRSPGWVDSRRSSNSSDFSNLSSTLLFDSEHVK